MIQGARTTGQLRLLGANCDYMQHQVRRSCQSFPKCSYKVPIVSYSHLCGRMGLIALGVLSFKFVK